MQIVAVDASDVEQAFSVFARYHWRRFMTSPIGIWTGGKLAGRELAGTDPDGYDRPYLQVVRP